MRPLALPSLALASALVAAAPPARAALLDEPPKLYNFRLDDPQTARIALLDPFRDAASDPSSSLRRYLSGTWGRWRAQPWWALAWQSAVTEELPSETHPRLQPLAIDPNALLDEHGGALFGFVSGAPRSLSIAPAAAPTWLARLDPAVDTPLLPTTGASFKSNGFDALWSLPPKKPIIDWRCRRRPVRIGRYGGESDSFAIVRCDGSAAVEAYDRLTLLAREPSARRPGELLPDEPDPVALTRGEWTMGVHLVHPRLLWVVQRIADAFPWRTIYIYSGYRPGAKVNTGRAGSHQSMHSEARALDISVLNVPNEALFKLCHGLDDIGCGFYPHSRFIHVDVRLPGSGHPFWIDTSGPGEPASYVDSWPGVIDHGGIAWDAAHQSVSGSVSGAEATHAH